MLGWEFPPEISGGLGVACESIARHLGMHHHVELILPKRPRNYATEGVNITAVNTIDVQDDVYERNVKRYETAFRELEIVETHILPYETISSAKTVLEPFTTEVEDIEHYAIQRNEHLASQEQVSLFSNEELYAGDVINKVIQYARIAANLASEKEFDVIYAHDWLTVLAGIEIKKRTGKPLVFHVHSLEYDRGGPLSKGWVYDLEQYGMQQADRVVAVSGYTKGVIVEHYTIDTHKVATVHNGIDAIQTKKGKKGVKEDVVLFLGRVTEQKGPEFFLEVASRVMKKHQNVRFVMAGTGSQLKRTIEAGAFAHVGHRFHVTGPLN
jgi:glycosyltransferase involved in cell wall biosynthesis